MPVVLEKPKTHYTSGFRAPLECNTKFASPLLDNRFVKASLPPLVHDVESKIRNSRYERFLLLAVARKIFFQQGVQEELEFPQNFHRTAKCHHTTVGSKVDIYKTVEHGKAHYKGLAVCGDVWNCPVCSAKIQEKRRQEVAMAMDWAYTNGFKCVMVTLTLPHTKFDKLEGLFESQKNSLRYLRSGKAWSKYKEKIGFQGLIRSLELTHGDNGWHPHTHELWIINKDADASALREKVVDRWYKACLKNGVEITKPEAFKEHSVDIVDNASNSDYLAKMDDEKHWGIDRELVKGNSKKGMHPFLILRRIFQGETNLIPLFLEYSKAVKGKKQLWWSAGLKAKTGVEDKTDKELSQEVKEESIYLASLSLDQWQIIVRNNLQSELLDVAEEYGLIGIEELLKRWKDVPS